MKQTKQKEAILQAVFMLKNHPTADEIYAVVKKDNERLSLGTVYRNLNTFASNGEIQKLSVPGLSDRFDFRVDNHEHILCEKCHGIFDVNANINLDSILDNNTDIKVTDYKLMLYGICSECNHL